MPISIPDINGDRFIFQRTTLTSKINAVAKKSVPVYFKIVFGVLALAFVTAPLAIAQPLSDSFEQGQQLYQANCALCHQDSGAGDPPFSPALSGNDLLGDLDRIVSNIRQGAVTMPAFPDLTAADIASLATYIRSAWENDFGSVTTADVVALLEGPGEIGQMASVWEGVFTEAQADRGQGVYDGACGLCHGRRLNGAPDDPDMRSSPPLARAKFLRDWEGRSLATLLEYTRATMPENNPGSLSDQEYVDVIAYMLSVSRIPAGSDELPPDAQSLARTVIQPQP